MSGDERRDLPGMMNAMAGDVGAKRTSFASRELQRGGGTLTALETMTSTGFINITSIPWQTRTDQLPVRDEVVP